MPARSPLSRTTRLMSEPRTGPAGGRDRITDVLLELRGGNPDVMDRLLALVYGELRLVAHAQLRRERPGHTLGTTGVVHETYLRLVDQTRVEWRDRTHFFGAAARAMRRILVDYARRNRAARRGGGRIRLTLDDDAPAAERSEMLLALDEALERLAALDPRLSRVVEYRYFGGLTDQETADVLGVTRRTVQRDWVKARNWLYLEMNG
jgi:RNA polymerase sigma factor (TIGR02999 family)